MIKRNKFVTNLSKGQQSVKVNLERRTGVKYRVPFTKYSNETNTFAGAYYMPI
jgi:hypothetical protein